MMTGARWQSGYAAACKAVYAGSIPTLASNNGRRDRVFGTRCLCMCDARVAELVDAADLKSAGFKPCRFESGLGQTPAVE